MTNELKDIFRVAADWQLLGYKMVLATVVHLEGSSYRRPGVRMLMNDKGGVFGAVSGGCIEKEIQVQAQQVFETGKAKMMTYDGRFRLGCEGIIYLLLEPLSISPELLEAINRVLIKRAVFQIKAHYALEVGASDAIGSVLLIAGERYFLRPSFIPEKQAGIEVFSQDFPPLFQLYIFGAEHDAVHLCKAVALLGWEVTIVASPKEAKSIEYFPGATHFIAPIDPAMIDTSVFDEQTAIILMSHSFPRDMQYLLALRETKPAYFGMLGSKHRRERLIAQLLEYHEDTSFNFLEQLYGPAGINIGAESPAEIAISILAEILSVVRRQEPLSLKNKVGSIHG